MILFFSPSYVPYPCKVMNVGFRIVQTVCPSGPLANSVMQFTVKNATRTWMNARVRVVKEETAIMVIVQTKMNANLRVLEHVNDGEMCGGVTAHIASTVV